MEAIFFLMIAIPTLWLGYHLMKWGLRLIRNGLSLMWNYRQPLGNALFTTAKFTGGTGTKLGAVGIVAGTKLAEVVADHLEKRRAIQRASADETIDAVFGDIGLRLQNLQELLEFFEPSSLMAYRVKTQLRLWEKQTSDLKKLFISGSNIPEIQTAVDDLIAEIITYEEQIIKVIESQPPLKEVNHA